MLFGSHQKLKQVQLLDFPNIIVNNVTVPFSSSAKNLGVILSGDLTWNDHISHTIQKINGTLSNLFKHSNCLPRKTKVTLIKTLVFPLLDYACVTYDSLSGYLDGKLSKILNRCIRFIFGLSKDTRITPYRKKLQWLTPASRRTYFCALQTYKILDQQRPYYLFPYLNPISPFHTEHLGQIRNKYLIFRA